MQSSVAFSSNSSLIGEREWNAIDPDEIPILRERRKTGSAIERGNRRPDLGPHRPGAPVRACAGKATVANHIVASFAITVTCFVATFWMLLRPGETDRKHARYAILCEDR
jgi:hypothetical protein